jgi:hypothetical protein
MSREAGILDRDPGRPVRAQRGGDQPEPLHVATAHEHPARLGSHAARAAEVVGERLAQLAGAADVAVAERGVGDGAQRAPLGGQPGGARERRKAGKPGWKS